MGSRATSTGPPRRASTSTWSNPWTSRRCSRRWTALPRPLAQRRPPLEQRLQLVLERVGARERGPNLRFRLPVKRGRRDARLQRTLFCFQRLDSRGQRVELALFHVRELLRAGRGPFGRCGAGGVLGGGGGRAAGGLRGPLGLGWWLRKPGADI